MAKKILLADDSITIQKVVELTFSDGDYEVTAVNNGAKAIQKLSEMRPDIILSDIIMPEKNGYEVCEFVKSHPEFRTIPVVLLTGTFEPFDPDRADKAGCDAVVTKPFESQSLIHKVEELIEHAKSQAPTSPAIPAVTGFGSDSPFAPQTPAQAPPSNAFSTATFQSHGEIFGGPAPTSTAPPTTEMPFEAPPAGGGETRAFPRMSFDEVSASSEPAPPPPPPPTPEPATPWDEPAPTSGETRAFPRMSFDDLQRAAAEPQSSPPPPPASTPSDTLTPFAAPTAPPPSPMAEPSMWDEGGAGFAGETRAIPKVRFDELEKMASQAPPMPAPPEPPAWAPPPEPSAWAPPPEPPRFAMGPGDELPPPAPQKEPSAAAPAGTPGELSDEQVDRIARRVVQLMSETVVRNIAWEVIPDLAEMVVKERIRQLESE
jgi:CheY-like chemotaxis protein